MPKPIMFPVYIVVDDDAMILPSAGCKFVKRSELPAEGTYFAVTADRLWQSKKTGVVNGLVPVSRISFLCETLKPKVSCDLPPMPLLLVAKAHRFFAEVLKKYHSEAEVMLLFDRESQNFDLWCPEQKVNRTSVHYALEGTPSDVTSRVVGTIHSHCDFNAFHSSVDTNDEEHQDGLHITLGHVDDPTMTVVSSIVINGCRLKVEPTSVIPGLEAVGDRYKVVTDEALDAELKKFEEQTLPVWLSKVTRQVYTVPAAGWFQWSSKSPMERLGEDDESGLFRFADVLFGYSE